MTTRSPVSGTFERPQAVGAPLVMLVDDDDDSSEMYAHYLRGLGFHIITSSTIAAAVEVARRSRPRAIVIDFTHFDEALMATRVLQEDARTWNVPVLVLTLLPPSEARGPARNAGASSVLGKPCLPRLLASELKHMLALASTDSKVIDAKRQHSARRSG
jgi:DNA-binding response OmpR family regulator